MNQKIIAMFQSQNVNHTNVHFRQRQRCPFPRPKRVSKFQASPALLYKPAAILWRVWVTLASTTVSQYVLYACRKDTATLS